MKLGYLVPEFPGQTHIFFWREILALEKTGVQLFLISTKKPNLARCHHEFARTGFLQVYYLFPFRMSPLIGLAINNPAALIRGLSYVLKLRRQKVKDWAVHLGLVVAAADLFACSQRNQIAHIHCHSCANSAHIVALAHCMGGPPYSLTLHGDLPVYGSDFKCKMAQAKFVACVTRALQNQVHEEVEIGKDKLPVISMGVETASFQATGIREYITGKLNVLMVSRLHPAKGHKVALEAIRILRSRNYQVRLTIVGEGPAREEIEGQILTQGLNDIVALVGTRSEDEVCKFMGSADVLILPSVGLGEAAPVVVMEAMSCGLPVVSSIIGGTPDMISHLVDGILVKQGDSYELASELIKLADDLDFRKKIGARARDAAVRKFDSSHKAQELLSQIIK